jgi:hypothetical protein
LASWWSPSATTRADDRELDGAPRAREEGSRGSWPRTREAGPVILDAGLLGLEAARLEARVELEQACRHYFSMCKLQTNNAPNIKKRNNGHSLQESMI